MLGIILFTMLSVFLCFTLFLFMKKYKNHKLVLALVLGFFGAFCVNIVKLLFEASYKPIFTGYYYLIILIPYLILVGLYFNLKIFKAKIDQNFDI